MKKSLKWIISILLVLSIFLLKDNRVYATIYNEVTIINPVYENILSEKEKQIILQAIEQETDTHVNTKTEFRTYNDTIYTKYNDLLKAIQQNFINRKTQFTIIYRGPTGSDLRNVLNDAMGKDYINSSDSGDYLRYSMGGSSGKVAGELISNNEMLYYLTINAYYYTTYSQEQELKTKVSQYLNSYNWKQKSRYEIIRDFNEYICNNAEYDYEGLEDSTNFIKYTAYGALIKGKAVCQGYTNLYYKMLKDCGINNIMVRSDKLNHIWNAIEYKGLWYSVDTTWNDTTNYRSLYFMKSIKDFGHGDLADADPAISEVRYSPKSLDMTTVNTPVNLDKCSVSKISNQRYTGLGITPQVTIKYETATLKEGIDYIISYKNNVNIGIATAIITGKGDYAGTITTQFEINNLGDIDGNTKITTKDAKMILQHIVKKITLTNEQIKKADVDGNGKITTKDAKLILQYIVKKISKFPIEN